MTALTHIFFDIGGVLGSNGWDHEQRERATRKFDLNPDDFEWRHKEVVSDWEEGRITLDEYLDIAIFHTTRAFSRKDFVEFMRSQSVPDEAAIGIARALARHAGYTMMTLNNESEELNMYRIEKFGISQVFEAFLCSCWLGVRKPLRRCYHRALGIAHVRPEATLFIDDRQQNLISASTLGMNVLHFTSAVQLRSDLERLLDLELSGA
ncbi:MAG TPA: HAD-IA family hydrolase [Gemmatimonadaceae bacterium]|nr:HAD-IA family hydrolase [Gemmatimonadaceae bacterium]